VTPTVWSGSVHITRSVVPSERLQLTVLHGVERSRHRFAGRVVAAAHAALVPPGFGVQHVVAARLLLGGKGTEQTGR